MLRRTTVSWRPSPALTSQLKRTFRPRSSGGAVRTRVLHLNNKVSKRDREQADAGVLKGVKLSSAVIAPSLYYHLSNRCGIGFTEADHLVQGRRIWVSGKALEASSALSVQIPAHIIDQLEVEVVNQFGVRVPAVDRKLHRYYGFHHLANTTSSSTDEADPRSLFHVLRRSPRVAPAHVVRPFEAAMAALPVVDSEEYAVPTPWIDGMDSASGLVALSSNALAYTNFSGLVVVTNDTSMRPHFHWTVGCGTVFDIVFPPGADEAVVDRLAVALREIVDGLRVSPDAEHLIERSVATRVAPLKTVRADEAAGLAAARVLPDDDVPVKVLRVASPCLPRDARKLIRAVAPLTTRCLKFGSFTLAEAKLAEGEFRRMNDDEIERLLRLEKTFKTQRLVASLRSCVL